VFVLVLFWSQSNLLEYSPYILKSWNMIRDYGVELCLRFAKDSRSLILHQMNVSSFVICFLCFIFGWLFLLYKRGWYWINIGLSAVLWYIILFSRIQSPRNICFYIFERNIPDRRNVLFSKKEKQMLRGSYGTRIFITFASVQ